MKRQIIFVGVLISILAMAAVSGATPITFTVLGPSSSVQLTNQHALGSANVVLEAILNPALASTFTLADGETQTLNFFDLKVSGDGTQIGTADIEAVLAFNPPEIATTGSGITGWVARGGLSAEVLIWDPSTVPNIIQLVNGPSVRVDFENIWTRGNTTVHAYITNLGDGSASPVPEPGTLILLGSGLLGLAIRFRRK